MEEKIKDKNKRKAVSRDLGECKAVLVTDLLRSLLAMFMFDGPHK